MQNSIFALVPTLCLAAACGGNAANVVDASPAPGPDAASTVAILAATVTPETVAAGQSVTLTVVVENFEIVNPMTTPGIEPGKGHFHYQLDIAPAYTAAWTPSVVIPIGGTTPPGEHTIDVWLVNGGHVDIDPPTHTPVTITVE